MWLRLFRLSNLFLPRLLAVVLLAGVVAAWGQTPASPPDTLSAAKTLLDQGHVAEAEAAERSALQTHPDSAEAHFLLGYILFREIQARVPQEKYPDGVAYHAPSASDVQAREEKARASLAQFTAGARFRKPGAFDLKIVALDYVLLRDLSDADRWLTLSLSWNPGDAQGWYYLGRTKYNENRFAEAVAAFQHSLQLDPHNVRTEDNLGLALEALERTSDAMAAYQHAIAWQAQSAAKIPEPLIDLGSLLVKENRAVEAVPYLTQAAAIAPAVARTHRDLGKAYEQIQQLKQAQAEFETAVKLAPDNAGLHFMLGQVYRKEGLTEKAKAEFERCSQLQGTHSSDYQPQ